MVRFLESKGCKRIGIIGKSFGGCVALTYFNNKIGKMVLWAPAIGISDKSNIDYWENRKGLTLSNLSRINLDKQTISKHSKPILIIHGTKDGIFPIANFS